MAVGALTGTLIRLISTHGILRGVQMAKKLGFRGKSIQKAFRKSGTLKDEANRVLQTMDDWALTWPEETHKMRGLLQEIAPKMLRKYDAPGTSHEAFRRLMKIK